MNIPVPAGIGWIIALIVLVVTIIFALADASLTRDWLLGGFAALALARLLP